ncbi:MAG: YqgE/AlgH family protein [Roseovarius sp.]|nr:YqgE/AlgH family protein [Roseovarius sp.]
MSDTPTPSAPVDLTGKILIAMPGMGDPRFAHSVVYLCAHSAEGAMGLIINKPTQDLRMRDLLDHLSITPGPAIRDIPVHFGGPVEHGRGFVLHDDGYRSDIATLNVAAGFGMTATLDILEDLAGGRGPERAILALGYAGWGPDQLEAELADNGWLTCDADAGLVFDTDDAGKWEAALSRLGISSLTLSSDAGHA